MGSGLEWPHVTGVRSSSAGGPRVARSWHTELNLRRQRFGRDRRLTSTEEYDAVLTRPTLRRRNRLFSILARDMGIGHPRLGLIVARRHVKRAVGRNRIKRQIRGCFRKSQHELPPMDIVVMTHAGIAECSNARLSEALERSFVEIGRESAERGPAERGPVERLR